MRSKLRVFISSPADVQSAREIAAQTIERLSGEYVRFFSLEPFLWENEPLVASGHFQDDIELPSNFDVFTLILWSRLGTPLPEKTEIREYRGPDGRKRLTGSEWEFETALAAARSKGSPDVLVYRCRAPARVDSWDAAKRQEQLGQMAALDSFWSRHFSNEDGFLAAYSEFDSLEQFSKIFETHIRQLLQKKINSLARGQRERSEVTWPDSPFRGLEAYEFEQAPIYFGQDDYIGKALLQLTENARNGSAFLVLLGSSGAGKSSLAKAGIVPRLFVPRRVAGAAFVRRLVFRPSDAVAREDLFDSLARRLVEKRTDDHGLPELVGPGQSVGELGAFLRGSVSNRSYIFSAALAHVSSVLRADGSILESESAKLILVVDQLEELFTIDGISAEQRRCFVDLLADLACSQNVWIVATMRSDFWHRAAEVPGLVRLAQGNGRLDVLPPTPAKIAEMIRQPAAAAGISYESLGECPTEGRSGTSLDETILDEVVREPGALPLLSYLLDQLYRLDILEAHGDTLTYASYERLHGLKGAIAARAEAILAAQDPEVRLALRQLLFLLVQISETESGAKQITARRAPNSLFSAGSPVRRLLDVFVDPSARLVVAEGSTEEPTYRVAHEALFREWALARELVSQIVGELKTRKMIEERYERWKELRDAPAGAQEYMRKWIQLSEPGLLADADLEDARRLLAGHRDALPLSRVAYIDRSDAVARRRRNFSVQGLSALVAILSVLLATAVVSAISANHYSAMVKRSLENMDKQHSQLTSAEHHGDALMMGKGKINAFQMATELYRFEIALGTTMHALQPDNLDWMHDIASGNARMGWALQNQGRARDALPLYLESLEISKQLVARDPSNSLWKEDETAATRLVSGCYGLLRMNRLKSASRP